MDDYESLIVSRRDHWLLHYRTSRQPLASYEGLMLDAVTAYPSLRATPANLEPQQVRELVTMLRKRLEQRLGRLTKLRIASEPGPRVARLRLALTNVRAATDRERDTARGLHAALDLHPGSPLLALQDLALEVEIVSSTSGERLVALVDGRAGQRLDEWIASKSPLKRDQRLDALIQDLTKSMFGPEMLR